MKNLYSLSLLFLVVFTIGCTTLTNRRDLYSPQPVEGPYTRMLNDGIPKVNPSPSPLPASDFKKTR